MAIPSRPAVLALDFGGTKFAFTVAEPDGERLATREVEADAPAGGRAGFDRCVAAARDLLAQAAPGREVAAVGASTFGIPFDDRIELAPAIPGWEDLPFGRELRAAFPGAAVTVTTDVKAAAAAEARWGALAGCDPGVYLNLGTGLAAAVVAGGRVLAGAHGAAGEIGYNLRAVTDVGSAERTILEEAVSGLALGRLGSVALGGTRSAQDVFDAASEPASRPEAAALLQAFTGELAFHMVNLAILIDPRRIVVGGGMTRSFALLRPALEHALRAGVPYPPELALARFPEDAPLMGALALAVESARELLGETVHT
jgi:glucokinase